MRIVHLSTRLDYYGGEVCVANLAAGLAGRGHEVWLVGQPAGALAERMAGGPVQVVPVSMVDWFDPGTVLRVHRCLRRLQPDILATHLPRDYFIAALASRGLPVCNIATRHQLTPLSLPSLKRPFLGGFAAMVAVSEAVAAGVRQARLVPAERVIVVPNGIPVPMAAGPGPGLRELAGVSAEDPVIGMVGKLSPEKGADFLLRAAGILVRRWPSLQVILVGDGDAQGRCRAHLARVAASAGLGGRVRFLGYVPEAGRRVHEFDILAVPSVAESFGLVTLEAMAHGVPVVATAAGGSPEIIREGREGFLVRPGDVEALAGRLGQLLASPGLRREMGQRGCARFAQRYTAGIMVARTEEVYQRALGRTSRSGLAARG